MKNLTLILFLIIPFHLFSQIDTSWNHQIMESDLILHVEIEKCGFVTQAGFFFGKILQVVKGEYNDSLFHIYLGLTECSRTRWEKRLSAICPRVDQIKFPYRCYAGFITNDPFNDIIVDPKTQQKYYFFMSAKSLNAELKYYFCKRFWMKKLMLIYFRLPGICLISP